MRSHVIKGGRSGKATELRSDTFTGQVLADPVLGAVDGVAITSVSFAPGARTFWHTHVGGQVLIVTSGAGVIAERSGERSEIVSGDVVFIPPDVEHWHGAAEHTAMTHLAISLGAADWRDAVADEDYA